MGNTLALQSSLSVVFAFPFLSPLGILNYRCLGEARLRLSKWEAGLGSGSGTRETGNGKRETGTGKWERGNGAWAMGNRTSFLQFAFQAGVGHGKREKENGKAEMGNALAL